MPSTAHNLFKYFCKKFNIFYKNLTNFFQNYKHFRRFHAHLLGFSNNLNKFTRKTTIWSKIFILIQPRTSRHKFHQNFIKILKKCSFPYWFSLICKIKKMEKSNRSTDFDALRRGQFLTSPIWEGVWRGSIPSLDKNN